jgi:hypothetical protein
MALPAISGSRLALIETEIILCAQEAFFNSPAQAYNSGSRHFFAQKRREPQRARLLTNPQARAVKLQPCAL